MTQYEFSSQANDENYFRELADVYLEPLAAHVFSEMRVYNELLAREFVDGERITEIMNELDGLWRILKSEKAVASGYFFFSKGRPDNPTPPQRDYYEDQEVIFNGVIPVPIDYSWDDDGNRVQTYELQVQLIKEGIADDEENTYLEMRGSARVDDIIALEFPAIMSLERARHWLEIYHADAIDEIDILLLNPSKDECEMVQRLASVQVDSSTIHQGDETLMLRSAQAFNVYTNSLFSFDSDMHYYAQIDGECWVVSADMKMAAGEITEPTSSPMKISGLVWDASCDDEPIIIPHLDAHLLTDDKDSLGYHILMPLTGVQKLQSLRQLFFDAHNG